MSLLIHRNDLGVVDYHLIIQHNFGPDRKKVLFSNLPLELIEESSPPICQLIKNQHRCLDLIGQDLLENLSTSVERHPSLEKYIYPKEVLQGKDLPNNNLVKLLRYWNVDMGFFPNTIVSWELEPVRQYVFSVLWERYIEFHFDKFQREVFPISIGEFECNMLTIAIWSEYKKLDLVSEKEYFKTETIRGFDCFILSVEGKPVFEFVV